MYARTQAFVFSLAMGTRLRICMAFQPQELPCMCKYKLDHCIN